MVTLLISLMLLVGTAMMAVSAKAENWEAFSAFLASSIVAAIALFLPH